MTKKKIIITKKKYQEKEENQQIEEEKIKKYKLFLEKDKEKNKRFKKLLTIDKRSVTEQNESIYNKSKLYITQEDNDKNKEYEVSEIKKIKEEKDKEIEKIKEETKIRREKEKKKFCAIANKYDRQLTILEKENSLGGWVPHPPL